MFVIASVWAGFYNSLTVNDEVNCMAQDAFPPEHFRRRDERSDRQFYDFPRLVVHIDDHAISALNGLYARLLPAQGTILDLMSSWRSHLPDTWERGSVVGLGMNPVEMAQNPQLDRHVVHDLNTMPQLPFEDNVFDAVLCAVSVQYMTRPVEVFRDVYRIIKPDGLFVVSFSNRCFPDKAIAAWLTMTDEAHVRLVQQYFQLAHHWVDINTFADVPAKGDPLFAVWTRKPR